LSKEQQIAMLSKVTYVKYIISNSRPITSFTTKNM